ncbi:MAG: trigger factor [Deltaproteobacteria bacterium]|jgi:trigger factor|nr:trigger factor [Deltaproteobacteria bacterium]
MQHTIEDLSPTSKKIVLTLPVEAYSKEFESLIKILTAQSRIKGFRPGKAPRAHVIKQYHASIASEITKNVIAPAAFKIIDDAGFEVSASPVINEYKIRDGQPLVCELTFEHIPTFELPNFEEYELTRLVPKVDDKIIERTLQEQARKVATVADAEPDHLPEPGNRVSITYRILHDGKEIEKDPAFKGKGRIISFELGNNKVYKEIEEAVRSHKAGESFLVPMTMPANTNDDTLRGKDVVFEISLDKILTVDIPPLNDDLAKDLDYPGIDTLEKLREAFKEQSLQQQEYAATHNLQQQIYEKLTAVKLEIPESLINTEVDRNIARYREQTLKESRKTPKDTLETWLKNDSIRATFKRRAIESVTASIVLSKAIKEHKFDVTEAEIDDYIQNEINSDPRMDSTTLEQLKSKDYRNSVASGVATNRVYEYIISRAKVTDVDQTPPSDLRGEAGTDAPATDTAAPEAGTE